MTIGVSGFVIDADVIMFLAKDSEETEVKEHWYSRRKKKTIWKIVITTKTNFTQTITYASKEVRDDVYDELEKQFTGIYNATFNAFGVEGHAEREMEK